MRSESDDTEYEEIEVTDNSELEPEPTPTPSPLLSPPSPPRDRISSMECDPTEGTKQSSSNSVENKMEVTSEVNEERISSKQDEKSVETEVKSDYEVSPQFGGYPVKLEVNQKWKIRSNETIESFNLSSTKNLHFRIKMLKIRILMILYLG